MPLAMILYLHGFNSSPASLKARLLKERLESLGRGGELLAPALPHQPSLAIARAEAEIVRAGVSVLVGSSLGGYYATWLAEQHGLKAVLVNPAVAPYRLLQDYLGPQTNLYTGEKYLLTPQHIEELKALEVEFIRPERYLLLVATGDEVLDYRRALEKYQGAKSIVVEGGDHAFSDFGSYLDTVIEYALLPRPGSARV